ncbi:MAG TPA: RteC domain-containing protein [Bacteroidia bacterium]|nr:RteC domain-containing protein [Bacteroidia bacterium]
MKQHAENLAKRLVAEFQEIETLHQDKLPMLLKKVEVANILVQELQSHVTKYKLIQSEKEQVVYYKYCLPLIQKWVFAFEFIHTIEKEALLGTQDMKAEYYKNALHKLNSSYKRRTNEFCYIRQNDKRFENSTLISSNLNNNIISLFEAHFIAEEYLINRIAQLKINENSNPVYQPGPSNCKWVKSKTDLVELCYAIFYGNCAIDVTTQKPIHLTKLAVILEAAFSAELKDYKRLFSDVKKRRESDSFTKFLQQTIQHQIEIHFK